MDNLNTLSSGALIVIACSLVAAASVIVSRWLTDGGLLVKNRDFVESTYPIIGLVYGTFLAFTIVITWGKFNEAETSTTSEVTHLSELWRNAEAFPEAVCKDIHSRLLEYAKEVVASGWASMAESGRPSSGESELYENIWPPYYGFEPVTETEKAFYAESIGQLNELGRDRRYRILFAGARVQPVVRFFLISGGILIVAFSLLLVCPILKIQIAVTTLIASLTSFSIFLVLSLQEPFSGDVSVKPTAFTTIIESIESRRANESSCRHQANGAVHD